MKWFNKLLNLRVSYKNCCFFLIFWRTSILTYFDLIHCKSNLTLFLIFAGKPSCWRRVRRRWVVHIIYMFDIFFQIFCVLALRCSLMTYVFDGRNTRPERHTQTLSAFFGKRKQFHPKSFKDGRSAQPMLAESITMPQKT